MLFDSTRHETLNPIAWDEGRARDMIQRVVHETQAAFSPESYWPMHPRDGVGDGVHPEYSLYYGACGVMWALHYLDAVGAASIEGSYQAQVDTLLQRNHEGLIANGMTDFASYLMGDLSVLMLAYGLQPTEAIATQLEALIRGNLDQPCRELMWGSPGTLLAALFLHEKTGEARWADLFRLTARKLWAQLLWSEEHQCHYWTQDLYGQQSTYLDAVHGFVATASPIIRGRHLLTAPEWTEWEQCIENTIARTATLQGDHANWRVFLNTPEGKEPRMLMQFCHGAPGFVICLADLPGATLDGLLLAGGEATWAAGPLTKGSNLCHGTGGNGYTFLKLYQRTGDTLWLDRARAFAMHAIAQTEADAKTYGHLRFSLWTGDPGFAIYLWDCICGTAQFPSLDVFFTDPIP